jgi:hypothetical protein
VERKEYIAIFCFLRSNVHHATNMHFKSYISCLFSCHIIDFLLTSLAWSLQGNIGPRSLCTNLALYGLCLYKKDLGPMFLRKDLALG